MVTRTGFMYHMVHRAATFTRERADERATLERVRGTERLYGLVVRFNEARKLGMKPEQYARFPDYAPMLAELAAAGFRDVPGYEQALARYYLLFQRRAGEIARLALANSESVVRSEIDRYGDPRRLRVLFDDLAPLRGMLDRFDHATYGDGAGSRLRRRSTTRTTSAGGWPSGIPLWPIPAWTSGRSAPTRPRPSLRRCWPETEPSGRTSPTSANRSRSTPNGCCSSIECGT